MEMNKTNENVQDYLKEFGRNLTTLASKNMLEPVIGRDDEIRRMIRILSRKTKNNPVLVGEPGVGKTAIVEGFAKKIIENQVPEHLKNKEVIELDLAALIAGASFQGQFEQRLKNVIKAIEEKEGQIIVFIDEIHMLIGAGRSGSNSGMDAANILKPLMARGTLHLIGATTFDEYRKYIESDAALERRMQKIDVLEPSIEDTITILRGIKERLERFHKVKIQDSALISAAQLSSRYISDRFLPDKAIDLVDEAAANIKTEINFEPERLEKAKQLKIKLEMEKAAISSDKKTNKNEIENLKIKIKDVDNEIINLDKKWKNERNRLIKLSTKKEELENLKHQCLILQKNGKYEEANKTWYNNIPAVEKEISKLEKEIEENQDTLINDNVTSEEIASIVSKWTQIPVTKLLEKEKTKLLNLEKSLNHRVIGQNEAVGKVAHAIQRAKANINDPERPLASFLFLGPTGVGKTELARQLAFELFDSEKKMIRLDMSEYMEKHSTSKILGSPPGYIGYDDTNNLSEKIRKNPYTILLIDEIEKAHPDVLNVFLQLLDTGSLTDSKGRHINCKNLIVIMTSNIGSEQIIKNPKISSDEIRKILLKNMKPEFINRIDEIISFNQLTKNDIKQIIEIELEKLKNRIYLTNKLRITFDNSVINDAINKGYDPIFGARPIKRFIQTNIESFLATKIIEGSIQEQKINNLIYKNSNYEIN